MTVRRWLALLQALVLLFPLAARAGEVAIGTRDSYRLDEGFSVLEDPSRSLSFQQVLQPEQQTRFEPLSARGSGANFGFNRSAFWLRVTLHTGVGVPRDWLLELASPLLNHIELYTPSASGYQQQETGNLSPYAARAVSHRNFVLPVALPGGTATTLYLRIQSEDAVSAPATLWQPEALRRHDQGVYAALGLYFGLLGGLLLYNLLLFFSVRDSGYLVYVLFAAAMAVFQAAQTGLGVQFIWPRQLWWSTHSMHFGAALATALALLFARNFLSSAARTPGLDRLMLLLAGGLLLSVVVSSAISYTVATFLITGLVLASISTLVAAGLVGVRYGHPGARNFMIAWFVLLLGALVLSLHNIGVLPTNAFTVYAVLFGSSLEMVLLSFALADRINVSRRFKQQAQTRIAAEKAMVQALSVSQEQLRTSLQEREVILDNSIVGIAFLTPKGRFRWANPTMLDILGARGREIDSMERFYLSREQYLEVGSAVAAHVRRGQVYEAEIQIRQWDGTLIWISLSGKGVELEGRVRGTVWVIMEITRRKQLEEELRAALLRQQDRVGWT
jgi:PAS domain S-box-containing protein